MEKNDRIHTITEADRPAQSAVIITRGPEKDRTDILRGCCPTAFPFGDL